MDFAAALKQLIRRFSRVKVSVLLILCLIALMHFFGNIFWETQFEELSASKENNPCGESATSRQIFLEPYLGGDDHFGEENSKLFFLETSGEGRLSPRQACAVESAVLNTDLSIVVIIDYPFLNLTANATCQLFYSFPERISFHQSLPELTFQSTPLEGVYRRGTFQRSRHRAVHLSDALRMAVLFKHGGWYLDLDFVVLRPLPSLLVGSSTNADKYNAQSYLCSGRSSPRPDASQFLLNGVLGFGEGHPLALASMEDVARRMGGVERGEIGQELLTRQFSPESTCSDLTVLPPPSFLPIPSYELNSRWRSILPLEPKEWEEEVFHLSFAAHFYSGTTANKSLFGDPTREPYTYLAQRHCPASYWSSKEFV